MGFQLIYYLPPCRGVCARIGAPAIRCTRGGRFTAMGGQFTGLATHSGRSRDATRRRHRRRRLRCRCLRNGMLFATRPANTFPINSCIVPAHKSLRISFKLTAPDCQKCEQGPLSAPPANTATVLTNPYFYGFFCLWAMPFEAHCATQIKLGTLCAHSKTTGTPARSERTSRPDGRDRDAGRLMELTRGDDSYLCRDH